MDDALRKLAQSVKVIRSLHRGIGGEIPNPMSVFPKPQRMFPADAPVKGGQYLSMPDKTDMTGHKSAAASIGVAEGGKPFFTASRDAVDETGTSGRGSAIARTNLFKQKAGWKWKDAPEGHENTNTIVSVEHRGQHHYALNAHFPKGVDLARYEDSPSEPRLRPTTRGNVEFGPQAGSILVRGREHPVYHHVIVKSGGGDVEGVIGHNQGPSLEDDPRFREYMSRILDPRNPEHFEAAKKIAENYGVNDLSYSGFKKHPILPSQVTTQIHDIPGAVPKPVNPMSWHDFYRIGKGGVLFTLGGDRSNLGRLTHINGVKLAWPIDLHAGTKYQREPNKNAVWANDKNAQKALLNNIKRINDKGQEAYGSFAPMGTGAIDSSKNMTDAMMSHIAASQIDKDAMREFDNLIRSGQHVYNSTPGKPAHKEKTRQKRLADMQEWPGLEDPWAARNFAFQKMSGQERSGMIKLLDRADLLNYGFPSVGNTRAAITDPELLHTSNNMTGGNIVRLSAEKHDPNDLSFIHSTYNTPTKGEYVGTVPFMPRHDVLPDFMQDQLMNPKYVNKSGPNKGEPLLVHPMSPNPMGRGSIRGNTEMRQGIQPINERMLESIEQGQDRIKKYGFKSGGRTAYKKGGKVEGSIWHDRDVFGFGGDTESAGSAPESGGSGTVAAEHEAAPEQHEQSQSDPEGKEHPSSEAEKLANQGTFPSWAGVNSGGNEAAVNKSAADVAASRLAQAERMSVLNNGVTNAQATAAETPPSAASAANAAMSAAFAPVGATTSFGQQPPQAGLFTPEHFESTLEQNLVEPAFSQPMTQPAFPHTPTPTADTATHLGGTPATGAIPDTATHLGGTPATGALGVTQPSFPHTPTPTTATPVSVAPSAPALTNTPMSQDLPASKIAGAPPAGFTPITPDPVGYFFDRMLGGFTSQGIHNPAGYSLGLPAGNPNSQQGQALLDQNARTPTSEGTRGGKTHMVQKKMPDGTYQWVEEPFKKGGKVYRRTVGSQMTDHVISKFGAKLPASNYQPIGSKAGRR